MTPADVQALDELLSEAQLVLRDGHHDHLSRAVAEVRNRTTLPMLALEALRDQWRADAEAKHRAEYQDNQVVREAFPRITTIEIRRWLKCAEDLDVLIHGAGGQEKENTE